MDEMVSFHPDPWLSDSLRRPICARRRPLDDRHPFDPVHTQHHNHPYRNPHPPHYDVGANYGRCDADHTSTHSSGASGGLDGRTLSRVWSEDVEPVQADCVFSERSEHSQEHYDPALHTWQLASAMPTHSSGPGSGPLTHHRHRHQHIYPQPYRNAGSRGISRNSTGHHQGLGSPKTSSVTFPAAAAKLNEVTKNAIRFFGPFLNEFQAEIDSLLAYANQKTISSVWRDRITKNECHYSGPRQSETRTKSRYVVEAKSDRDLGQEDDWHRKGKPSGSNHTGQDTSTDSDWANTHFHTFSDYQFELKRAVKQLLNCQIARLKFRYVIGDKMNKPKLEWNDCVDNNDYVDPEDMRNMAKFTASQKLHQRVDQCQRDLLPLLDVIGEDHHYMEAALIELNHLADLLKRYACAWGGSGERSGERSTRSDYTVEGGQHE